MIQFVVDYLYDPENAISLLKYADEGEELRILEQLAIKHIDTETFDRRLSIVFEENEPIPLTAGEDIVTGLTVRELIDAVVFRYPYYFVQVTVGRYTLSEALRNRERLFREFDCDNYSDFVSKTKVVLPLLININRDAVYSPSILAQHNAVRIIPTQSDDHESRYAARYLEGMADAANISPFTPEHDINLIRDKCTSAKKNPIPKHIAYHSGFQAVLQARIDGMKALL